MKKNKVISVIISTKNEEKNISNCLESITRQSYKNFEIIVVDNNSVDSTKEIARRYTYYVYNKGPERSAQRNYAAEKSKGEYLVFLDADMILTSDVLENCIRLAEKSDIGGIVIPEVSEGTSFWAKCKRLEKTFYLDVPWIEAARFFDKEVFMAVGGYNSSLISGEDWDIHQRVRLKFPIVRIRSHIIHNEGELALAETVKKKYYYARHIAQYKNTAHSSDYQNQSNILKRYGLFFSQPKKLFSNPVIGVGMLFMKSAEFVGGAIGYLVK